MVAIELEPSCMVGDEEADDAGDRLVDEGEVDDNDDEGDKDDDDDEDDDEDVEDEEEDEEDDNDEDDDDGAEKGEPITGETRVLPTAERPFDEAGALSAVARCC